MSQQSLTFTDHGSFCFPEGNCPSLSSSGESMGDYPNPPVGDLPTLNPDPEVSIEGLHNSRVGNWRGMSRRIIAPPLVAPAPQASARGQSSSSNFQLKSKRLFLTYSQADSLTKDVIDLHLRILFQPEFLNDLIIARETHQDGGQHFHVAIDYEQPFRTRNPRVFDINGIHPNIKSVRNAAEFKKVLNYISKEDPDVNRGFNDEIDEFIDGIKGAETLEDATKFAMRKDFDAWKSFSAIEGIQALAGPPSPSQVVGDWNPSGRWQEVLSEYLSGPVSARSVVWVMDKTGGSGKTVFCKWYCASYPRDTLYLKDGGTMRDVATIVQNAIKAGWTSKVCLVDLPRSAESAQKRIYEWMESIKDGVITTQKYQGTTKVFRTPHLVVFANWWPCFPALSMDRWKLFEVTLGNDGFHEIDEHVGQHKAQLIADENARRQPVSAFNN
jgi:hypothetical protein